MTKILKINSSFIVSPLTYICNRILSTGTFPDRLKFSEIQPTYKKDDKALITITGQFHYFLYFQKFLRSLYNKTLYPPFSLKQYISKGAVWLQV